MELKAPTLEFFQKLCWAKISWWNL